MQVCSIVHLPSLLRPTRFPWTLRTVVECYVSLLYPMRRPWTLRIVVGSGWGLHPVVFESPLWYSRLSSCCSSHSSSSCCCCCSSRPSTSVSCCLSSSCSSRSSSLSKRPSSLPSRPSSLPSHPSSLLSRSLSSSHPSSSLSRPFSLSARLPHHSSSSSSSSLSLPSSVVGPNPRRSTLFVVVGPLCRRWACLSLFGATRRCFVVAGAYSSLLGRVQGLLLGPTRFRWVLSSLGPTGVVGSRFRWVSLLLGCPTHCRGVLLVVTVFIGSRCCLVMSYSIH